ncbi:hypothetical protein RJ639_041230 [Escallonia herrerae]|uniref:Choline monooxygenase, chloroplastic n=1 Tax=Escallonia herrerae TaxID=1293975 RepID=A0AA89BB42_9ASTE|nr:hypothetical protein RJ639_041230 [Escallonia herrerae]
MMIMMMPMPRPLCFHLSEIVVLTRATDKHQPPRSCTQKQPRFLSQTANSCKSNHSSSPPQSTTLDQARSLVDDFNPKIPIEQALTPPTSWYTDPTFFSLELDRVFYRGWQAVGYTDQVKEARDYFTGRDGLEGKLLKATRITGIENFNVDEFGLLPLEVAIWGPFVLLNLERDTVLQQESQNLVGDQWLGSSRGVLNSNGVDSSLNFVCRREYSIECNWKVFCDNYLDGGYHVPYAHKGLASGLKLESYLTTMYEKVSIQRCDVGQVETQEDFDRLGSKALYAFIYPNFMINRYGPWMDTNLVLPLGHRKCQVIFDYFLDASLMLRHRMMPPKLTRRNSSNLPTRDDPNCTDLYLLLSSILDKLEPSNLLPVKHVDHETLLDKIISDSLLDSPLGSVIGVHFHLDTGLISFVIVIPQDDGSFIEISLKESEKVQMEDIVLCEAVQRGLESPAYCTGRYAPNIEKAMHHFHCLLHENLAN